MEKSIIVVSDYLEYRRTEALVVSQSGTNAYERAIFRAFLKATYEVYGVCNVEFNKHLLLGKGPWNYKNPDAAPEVIAFDRLYPRGLEDVYCADPETEPDWDYRFRCWQGNRRIALPKRVASAGVPKLYLLDYVSKSKDFDGHWAFLDKQLSEIGSAIEIGAVFVDASTQPKPDDRTIERVRLETVAAEGGAFCVDLTEKLRFHSPYSYNPVTVPAKLGGAEVEKFSSDDELFELMVRQMRK